ncbi:MAG: acyl-CoA reductase [Crocinitomicaceae bacterium]|nr:acyl-CoA reductase [Crocinitomicaceae bacterium]
MERNTIILALNQLGKVLVSLGENQAWRDNSLGVTQEEYERFEYIIARQFALNGWFTQDSVRNALKAIGNDLTTEKLTAWTDQYQFVKEPKRVGVIMAGNIPLVGFHDFLCVLLSGHKITAKMSSDDKTLLPEIVSLLIQYAPELEERIMLSDGRIGEIDAVIATGSNNSMGYFDSYFGKYPHIFRKNRTSIAVLNGKETQEELAQLGADIFTYFGLGCRNVSQVLIPQEFELNDFFAAMVPNAEIVNHHKYANNYDYNKAIHLMNQENILDNGFMLLKESDQLFSPLAMVFYHRYNSVEEVETYLKNNEEHIQAIVGKDYIPFGAAQCPKLDDYADNVNTMSWLERV